IGGFDTHTLTSLDTVESYDPSTGIWSTGASMPTARNDLGAAAGPGGKIFAVGGNNSSGILDTLEVYDPASTSTWSAAAAVRVGREGAAAVKALDGKIYVLGGLGEDASALSTVEVYDPSLGVWTLI